KAGIPLDERQGFLEMVREKAKQWPGDRLAAVAQARAEILFGDRATADHILDRVLAADKNDVEALELRALGFVLEGAMDTTNRYMLFAQARPYLKRAFAIDPHRYQTQFLYAVSASVNLDDPTDETMKALLRAHELAPQVGAITLMTAEALIKRNDLERA